MDAPGQESGESASRKRKHDGGVAASDNDRGPSLRESTSAPSKPDPSPPESRRYLALWKEYGEFQQIESDIEREVLAESDSDSEAADFHGDGDADSVISNGDTERGDGGSVRDSDSDSAAGWEDEEVPSSAQRAVMGVAAAAADDDVRQWEEEMELARYNEHVRRQMHACLEPIDEYKRDIDTYKRAIDSYKKMIDAKTSRIDGCRRQAMSLETKLDTTMVLPGAFRYTFKFWDKLLSSDVKHDKALAWLLIRSDNPLPVPFQKMLWTDPGCPLRKDRNILLASIDKGLDWKHVKIVWSEGMADDRELVRKCFEKCPGCLCRNSDESGLPKSYLKDEKMLRAFAFSELNRGYRTSASNAVPKFSTALFKDPMFMADLIVHLCRSKGEDEWARSRVSKSFLERPKHRPQPLLDESEFALHLAHGLLYIPPELRRLNPVKYSALSTRLQASSEVALAFVRAYGCILREEAPWRVTRRWKAAFKTDSLPTYFEHFEAKPQVSKALVIALLKFSRTSEEPRFCLNEIAKIFPKLPSKVRKDREISAQMVLSCAISPSTPLRDHFAPKRIQRRSFWVDLVKSNECPCSAWIFVPEKVAKEAKVIWTWARYACPEKLEWLVNATNGKHLDLLSDRQVLLNWVPQLCSDDTLARGLFRQISTEALDKSLWMELLGKGGPPRNYMSYLAPSFRNDPDVVDAQLLCSCKDSKLFLQCFSMLSDELQLEFSYRLVKAVQSDDELTFEHTWTWLLRSKPNLPRIPEVALAALSKGWGLRHQGFADAVNSSAWSNDPKFLLAAAAVIPHRVNYFRPEHWSRTFWACCSSDLRRDKGFLLQVLNRTKVPQLYMDEDLERDFDIKCALLLRRSEAEFYESATRDIEFVRDVRTRLQQYLSLEAFMAGVQAAPYPRRKRSRDGRSVASPLALLGQDDDTLRDFKARLVECLGCPAGVEEAVVLRNVSNKFTMIGY